MDTDKIPDGPPSMWVPTIDPYILGLLGKLIEENSESSGICARIIIQGIDGVHPETGKPNIDALMDEIADQYALLGAVVKRLGMSQSALNARMFKKGNYTGKWFDFLETLNRNRNPVFDRFD